MPVRYFGGFRDIPPTNQHACLTATRADVEDVIPSRFQLQAPRTSATCHARTIHNISDSRVLPPPRASCRMHIEHQLNSNRSACRNIHRQKTTLRHTTHRDALSRSQQDITSPNKYFFKNTRFFLGLFILSHNKPYSAEPAKTHQSQLCIKKKENLSHIHQAFFWPDETRSRPCRSL